MPSPHAVRKFDRSLIEGPILPAVWKLAWPSMLQNLIGGLQGVVDHALVGQYVGYTANAAVGVSLQIFIVVIVFISSLYTGMAVLVARFAGAGDHDRVNRTVYQAFLTSIFLGLGVLAPLGYFSAPFLLTLVNAAPEVQREALPFLRVMFTFSIGMLLFFMLSGAMRAAGDARTPMLLAFVLTALNIVLNITFITGLGLFEPMGTVGAAIGSAIAGGVASLIGLVVCFSNRGILSFSRDMSWRPDLTIIRSLFRFGLPAGVQGIAMNVAGVMLLRFIGSLDHSAEAQAAYAVGYTELFSFITWTSVGMMSATAVVVGQNLGANQPQRAARAAQVASRMGLFVAITIGSLFLLIPQRLLAIFGMTDPLVLQLGEELLAYLSVSGLFVTVALAYSGALQGAGDTRSPLYISIVSQIVVPLGLCALIQATTDLAPHHIWTAIVLGHLMRCTLSVLRFRQGKWQKIAVDIEPAAAR